MRQRKPPLPDPTDPALRRWVLGISPEQMHREACAFLRGRADLVREAFAHWSLAGFPSWPEHHSDMPLSLRLRLTERVTITSPLVRLGISIIPLLPFGTLVDPGPPRPAPGIRTPSELAAHQIIAAFQRTLIHEWWKPPTHDALLLAEHHTLYAALRSWRPANRRLWHALYTRAGSHREIRIPGHSYPLPRLNALTRESKAPPSRVAVDLLAHKHGINRTVLNAQLHSLRLEARIAIAWAGYAQWLADRPSARAELDRVLSTFTRDRSHPNPVPPGAPAVENPVRHIA